MLMGKGIKRFKEVEAGHVRIEQCVPRPGQRIQGLLGGFQHSAHFVQAQYFFEDGVSNQ